MLSRCKQIVIQLLERKLHLWEFWHYFTVSSISLYHVKDCLRNKKTDKKYTRKR